MLIGIASRASLKLQSDRYPPSALHTMLPRSRLLARPLRCLFSQQVRTFGNSSIGGSAPRSDLYIPTPYIEENSVSKQHPHVNTRTTRQILTS